MPFGLTNAPSVFQRLMQQVFRGLNPEDGPDFVSVYIDDILVFSRNLHDHLVHLKLVMERVQKAGLKLKPIKCHFIQTKVEYLGHVITPQGLETNPKLITAVTEFPTPGNVRETRQFLGLCSYYRRFVPLFAKIARALHHLTKKGEVFRWTGDCQQSFDTMKKLLTSAPVLAYPSFERGFILETDACISGIGAVLSQLQLDELLHPVAYASRALSQAECRYSITELETLAVVWAISHFHSYLYGHSVVVYTDHSAVRAVLESSNPSAKHARWWTKVYGSGIRNLKIRYRPGKANANADALSRAAQAPAPLEGLGEAELQVSVIHSEPQGTTITELLHEAGALTQMESLSKEQRRDPDLIQMMEYVEKGTLPTDPHKARRIALLGPHYSLVDGALFLVDTKNKRNPRIRAAVPRHLHARLMEEHHRGPLGSHFSGDRLFSTLSIRWWWHQDATQFVKNCPECAIVRGGGRVSNPPLHPIPVSRPFQILGIDIMDLPLTQLGNRHVVVFQDYLTKWAMVFPVPDQRAQRLARLLVEEIVPLFGVPECLLSDRGANLLSHLMMDVCELLGVKKLNTTSYHPQCNGMVERFNRTLKTMLRKHAGRFGLQWDQYLSGVLWAYRNTPHESTGEKPSFLLFGVDCRTPSEAALWPPTPLEATTVETYREELLLNLSSARELAAESLRLSQAKARQRNAKKVRTRSYLKGDWVLVKFPADETGRYRKLSQPWHGPYRVVSINEPDITVHKVYFPLSSQMQVHETRVTPCPDRLPPGYYWYGRKQCSPGGQPWWLEWLSRRARGLEPEEVTPAEEDSQTDNATLDTPPQEITDEERTSSTHSVPGSDGRASPAVGAGSPGEKTVSHERASTEGSDAAGASREEISLEDSFLSTMLGDPTSDAEPAAGVEEGLPDVSDPPAIENELVEDTLGTVEPAVKEKKRNRKLNPNQGSTRSRAGRGVKYSLRQRVRPPDRWSKLEGKL